MTLEIRINLDNAAFGDYKNEEVSRILEKYISKLKNDDPLETCFYDLNGNRVGQSDLKFD
jgi:hypothetical protein